MTEKECLRIVQNEYPDFEAKIIADCHGKYYVNLKYKKGSDNLADIHSVDKKTGEVSGTIPLSIILDDEDVRSQMEYPKKKNEFCFGF